MKTAILAAALTVLGTTAAHAQTIATSTFDSGDDGWTNGDLTSLGGTSAVIYNAGGSITVTDNYGLNALIAPTQYLGDQSAAFGGSIRFDLASATVDGPAYSPLTLIGGGLTLLAANVTPPSPTLTGYSVALTAANFRIAGDPYGAAGDPVTDAQLLTVLSSLERLAIQADWQTGGDFVTLDNVGLFGALGPDAGAVPEPASWALMIGGFGAVGAALRRRRSAVVRFA